MKAIDVILIIVIAGAVLLAVRSHIKKRRSGDCGCGCGADCRSCTDRDPANRPRRNR